MSLARPLAFAVETDCQQHLFKRVKSPVGQGLPSEVFINFALKCHNKV